MEVTRELVLPAPPEEVWDALTDPERLREWFANDVEWDGDELVYRWDDGEGEETRVTLELEEAEDGTLLTVTEGAGAGWATALGIQALALAVV